MELELEADPCLWQGERNLGEASLIKWITAWRYKRLSRSIFRFSSTSTTNQLLRLNLDKLGIIESSHHTSASTHTYMITLYLYYNVSIYSINSLVAMPNDNLSDKPFVPVKKHSADTTMGGGKQGFLHGPGNKLGGVANPVDQLHARQHVNATEDSQSRQSREEKKAAKKASKQEAKKVKRDAKAVEEEGKTEGKTESKTEGKTEGK